MYKVVTSRYFDQLNLHGPPTALFVHAGGFALRAHERTNDKTGSRPETMEATNKVNGLSVLIEYTIIQPDILHVTLFKCMCSTPFVTINIFVDIYIYMHVQLYIQIQVCIYIYTYHISSLVLCMSCSHSVSQAPTGAGAGLIRRPFATSLGEVGKGPSEEILIINYYHYY